MIGLTDNDRQWAVTGELCDDRLTREDLARIDHAEEKSAERLKEQKEREKKHDDDDCKEV